MCGNRSTRGKPTEAWGGCFKPHTDSTRVACLKDTVWGAFLISSSYYVCKSVLLFRGKSDIVPPPQCRTTDDMWYLLAVHSRDVLGVDV